MRFSALFAVLFALLTGCFHEEEVAEAPDPWVAEPHLTYCKAVLEAHLKSPSEMHMVKEDTIPGNSDTIVYLEFDAPNSYGTMIRGNIVCKLIDGPSMPKAKEITLFGETILNEAANLDAMLRRRNDQQQRSE